MIEFIENHCFEVAYLLMLASMISCLIELHFRKKDFKALNECYLKLNDELSEKCNLVNETRSELSNLACSVKAFVEKHNSWHDRKIAFYYDKDGWHCCYCDEIPQGDVVSEQEEINEPNEHNNENNQSI